MTDDGDPVSDDHAAADEEEGDTAGDDGEQEVRDVGIWRWVAAK